MIRKYASFDSAKVLELKGSFNKAKQASFSKVADFNDYRTDDNYLYARIRAISSRVNKNHDGWPSIELAGGNDIFDAHKHSADGFTVEASSGNNDYGFATFLGKPIFVDHNNSDPKRARGVIVDSKLRVLNSKEAATDNYWSGGAADPEHLPATEIELLLEIDAKSFPKFAKAIKNGDLDGFSMGCDIEYSKCSHCGHKAYTPTEYCSHIMSKGAEHDFKTADGGRISRKSYENCYRPSFFEISGVFDPADETALAREVRAKKEARRVSHSSFLTAKIANEGIEPQGPTWPWEQTPEPEIDENGQEFVRIPPHYPNVLQTLRAQEAADPGGGARPDPLKPMNQGKRAYLLHGEGFETQRQKTIREIEEYLDHLGYPHREASMKLAEKPQIMHPNAPEHKDTLRKDQICEVCGNEMEGDTCSVCGWVAPPDGFNDPDLTKAKDVEDKMKDRDSLVLDEDGNEVGADDSEQGSAAGELTSFLDQKTTNSGKSDRVKSDMSQNITSGRINQVERPIRSTNQPATNEPRETTVVSDPKKPVTSAMKTAQELIWKAQQQKQGDNMNQRTADGSAPAVATPDKRVDVTGVGGVIEPSNDAASKADSQVDVLGIGTTGVTDVEAESTESLPTADEKGSDAGFNTDKNIEAIPTKTFDDSDGTQKGVTDPVTSETPYWIDENKWSATTKEALDAEPWPNDEIEGGSANKGTQPADPVGKAQDRVDVLKAVTTPDNNSGPTSTWSGTNGNGVEKQADPVTNDLVWDNTDSAWTSHIIAAMEVADAEVELGLITRDEKYNRIASLTAQSDEVIENTAKTLSRVKTAGLEKLRRTAGVKKLPFAMGQTTSEAKNYEGLDSKKASTDSAEDVGDSNLFI